MKKPDEIKKGIELCIHMDGPCSECPYDKVSYNLNECSKALLEDAMAYIRQLEARVPRWIPVEERMPEEGKNVLIFVKCMNNLWHTEVDWRIGGCWFNNAETDWNKITHWMPLPEPPEEVRHE